jgi:cobalt-zinc-cadmium efflux system outer membrane protein
MLAILLISACTGLGSHVRAAEPFTIDELLVMADAHNPRIAAARAGMEEALGRQQQAGLYPNPFIAVMQDDVPSDSGDVGDGTTTVTLGQPVTLSRRRGHEVRAAEAGVDAAKWEFESVRHTVFNDLHETWFEIAFAGQAIEVEYALIEEAERLAGSARTEGERVRAELEAETLLAGVLTYVTRQAVARERLTELLGGIDVETHRLQGTLESALDPSEIARLQAQSVEEHPRLRMREAQVRGARSDWRAAESAVIPDVTFSVLGGYWGNDEEGFVGAGVMVPLPLINRLQGRRAEAKAGIARREAERDAEEIALETELQTMLQLINELDTLVQTYGTRLVPMAEESLLSTGESYAGGGVGMADALESLRSLAAVRRAELRYRYELSTTLSRYRHFVLYGPQGSPETVTATK